MGRMEVTRVHQFTVSSRRLRRTLVLLSAVVLPLFFILTPEYGPSKRAIFRSIFGGAASLLRVGMQSGAHSKAGMAGGGTAPPKQPTQPKSKSKLKPRRCYYDILGVARDAPDQVIHDAYKRLSVTMHPDLQGKTKETKKLANERMKLVGEAYSILADQESRMYYDFYRVGHMKGKIDISEMIRRSNRADEEKEAERQLQKTLPIVSFLRKMRHQSKYKGYYPGDEGFYSVYERVFQGVYDQEQQNLRRDAENITSLELPPAFGNILTPIKQVKEFYKYWQRHVSPMDFAFSNKYDPSIARNRRERKIILLENRQRREQIAEEWHGALYQLLEFIRQRDVRLIQERLEKASDIERQVQEFAKEARRQRDAAVEVYERVAAEMRANYTYETDFAHVSKPPDFRTVLRRVETAGLNLTNREKRLYCPIVERLLPGDRLMTHHLQSDEYLNEKALLRSRMAEIGGELPKANWKTASPDRQIIGDSSKVREGGVGRREDIRAPLKKVVVTTREEARMMQKSKEPKGEEEEQSPLIEELDGDVPFERPEEEAAAASKTGGGEEDMFFEEVDAEQAPDQRPPPPLVSSSSSAAGAVSSSEKIGKDSDHADGRAVEGSLGKLTLEEEDGGGGGGGGGGAERGEAEGEAAAPAGVAVDANKPIFYVSPQTGRRVLLLHEMDRKEREREKQLEESLSGVIDLDVRRSITKDLLPPTIPKDYTRMRTTPRQIKRNTRYGYILEPEEENELFLQKHFETNTTREKLRTRWRVVGNHTQHYRRMIEESLGTQKTTEGGALVYYGREGHDTEEEEEEMKKWRLERLIDFGINITPQIAKRFGFDRKYVTSYGEEEEEEERRGGADRLEEGMGKLRLRDDGGDKYEEEEERRHLNDDDILEKDEEDSKKKKKKKKKGKKWQEGPIKDWRGKRKQEYDMNGKLLPVPPRPPRKKSLHERWRVALRRKGYFRRKVVKALHFGHNSEEAQKERLDMFRGLTPPGYTPTQYRRVPVGRAPDPRPGVRKTGILAKRKLLKKRRKWRERRELNKKMDPVLRQYSKMNDTERAAWRANQKPNPRDTNQLYIR